MVRYGLWFEAMPSGNTAATAAAWLRFGGGRHYLPKREQGNKRTYVGRQGKRHTPDYSTQRTLAGSLELAVEPWVGLTNTQPKDHLNPIQQFRHLAKEFLMLGNWYSVNMLNKDQLIVVGMKGVSTHQQGNPYRPHWVSVETRKTQVAHP
ncbi:hypothetical protein CTI12_AA076450 [Artemisia annua]|uniref:Uncharacterized protein n=1 Tax=Artemisia annua TaxID=35608 RepID=A0A2U1Q4P3_ARTAN|nr:hypothetical protein CTI12_AA076450 [Artemisia annua]